MVAKQTKHWWVYHLQDFCRFNDFFIIINTAQTSKMSINAQIIIQINIVQLY